MGMLPPIAPEVCKGSTTTIIMTVTLNKSNYGNCEFGLSAMKKSESGHKFYWVLIYPPKGDVMYCATSDSFTALLGDNADDAKLAEVIKANQNKYEIANIQDKQSGTDATFEDGTPIYCIRTKAHRVAINW